MMKARMWRWKCFEARWLPRFWCVGFAVEFEKSYDRGIGVSLGPISFSLLVH